MKIKIKFKIKGKTLNKEFNYCLFNKISKKYRYSHAAYYSIMIITINFKKYIGNIFSM